MGGVKLQHILFMDPKAPFFKETYNNFKAAARSFMKSVVRFVCLCYSVDGEHCIAGNGKQPGLT